MFVAQQPQQDPPYNRGTGLGDYDWATTELASPPKLSQHQHRTGPILIIDNHYSTITKSSFVSLRARKWLC